MKREKYHGWIVQEENEGYRDTFYAEYIEGDKRRRACTSHSPAEVVEWWDKRVGQRIKLLPTPLGAFRVYTEEEEEQREDHTV